MILVENRLTLMHTGERLMNNNTTNESVEEIDQKRVRSKKTLYKLEVYRSGYWCNCTSYWGNELLSGNSLQFECYN